METHTHTHTRKLFVSFYQTRSQSRGRSHGGGVVSGRGVARRFEKQRMQFNLRPHGAAISP